MARQFFFFYSFFVFVAVSLPICGHTGNAQIHKATAYLTHCVPYYKRLGIGSVGIIERDGPLKLTERDAILSYSLRTEGLCVYTTRYFFDFRLELLLASAT